MVSVARQRRATRWRAGARKESRAAGPKLTGHYEMGLAGCGRYNAGNIAAELASTAQLR